MTQGLTTREDTGGLRNLKGKFIRNNLPKQAMASDLHPKSEFKVHNKTIHGRANVEGNGLSSLPHPRRRRQAGHTNRWQLPPPLGCDLLGQAQAEKAVTNSINTSLRASRTADYAQQGIEGQSTPLPRLTLPPDIKEPRGPQRCSPIHQKQSGPEDLFYLASHRVVHNHKPDVVLECMGSQWELHCPQLTKSATLTELYLAARHQRMKQHRERTGSVRGSRDRPHSRPSSGVSSRKKQSERKPTGPVVLHLSVRDHSVTREALSFALRTLYIPEVCPEHWGERVLSAAALLGLPHLFKRCLTEMIGKINSSTVCDFHHVACKYKETSLQRACERWLELYLVTELSCFINLRDLPFDLLHKTLRSPRVFTGCEYQLLKTVLYWVYLQFNPGAQILPSHKSIISFFSSWQRAGVFLEQLKGQKFIVLFQALRLFGITERRHLEEMQQIHVFPQAWLLDIFSKHYYTLHSGGDVQLTDFSQQAVRFGMIIEKEPQYCTQTVELYGFYFLLKAANIEDRDTHMFSLQRLRHWDPAMSVRACEQHPYSMMSERSVTHQIHVQSQVGGQWQEFSNGPVNKVFGLSKQTCTSQVYKLRSLSMPIFVTFALAFPAS